MLTLPDTDANDRIVRPSTHYRRVSCKQFHCNNEIHMIFQWQCQSGQAKLVKEQGKKTFSDE